MPSLCKISFNQQYDFFKKYLPDKHGITMTVEKNTFLHSNFTDNHHLYAKPILVAEVLIGGREL